MNVLVIDVGTSSMRGILLSAEGVELTQKQSYYSVTYMENSWVEQAPSDWEDALYEIVREVSDLAAENDWTIDAISLTAQRSSVIPVDRSVQPLCNAIMWQDKRTNAICAELEKENDRIFSLCGSRVNPVFSGSKMTWLRENRPEIYEKTYKFIVIPDLLIHRMTGRLCTDHTYGSRSLLMNLHTKQWDDELLALFRVEKDKLCELVEPGSVCGTTTEDFAWRTGCPEGIPVITAGGDQQCGAIGQGVVEPGALSVTAGTGAFLIAAADRVPENLQQNVICNCSSVPGQYVLESSVLTCCSAFDWFVKEFYDDCPLTLVDKDVMRSPIGANGCLCLPYFQGRSTPDWNNAAKGLFANITLNTRRCDMLRSLLEGICFEICNGIENMRDYIQVSDIYINGGLTNGQPFNEMLCSAANARLIRRGKADATARGALMVATAALGQYPTVADAYRAIGQGSESCIYQPEPEATAAYARLRNDMNELYRNLYTEG
ncbi:MAG: hypothetical protein IKU17_02735 [Clostridia bacterium]|nr:hypothetical protein [Clostridia bacterium]